MIIEYECPEGHVVERLRKYDQRDEPVTCRCGLASKRIEISQPHCVPDGMYSYAPNIGSERQFERRQQALRDGVKIIKKEYD